jgi:hypothetical protein
MATKRIYRVRFNLGLGVNYMKWQITNTLNNAVEYIEPSQISLILCNAKLRNQQATANKIFNGDNKSVCAWIACESVLIGRPTETDNKTQIRYNPRIAPNWMLDNSIVDNKVFDTLLTSNRSIYV